MVVGRERSFRSQGQITSAPIGRQGMPEENDLSLLNFEIESTHQVRQHAIERLIPIGVSMRF